LIVRPAGREYRLNLGPVRATAAMTAASNAIIDQEDRRCHDPQLLSGGEPAAAAPWRIRALPGTLQVVS
jgi:hypothetical protein